ncbi:MAG TPA: class I SAM-dependent methyltransferase [Candidatus Eisenbacteria bacterium]|nr:class I SAM-dependent methyltransferase [Candidatus Eisenbacteria bacterium]
MAKRVDLFENTYKHFTDEVLGAIRKDTFGTDIGQNSWLTVDEYERLLPLLNLSSDSHVLEVASGSGGPSLYLAQTIGCRVTGIDANENGVATASEMAAKEGFAQRVQFSVADANAALPFGEVAFDALLCIDSMNHFPNRLSVLREWCRVLRPGGRALFTDPVVVTGPVTNDELTQRSSVGLFLFVPPGINEEMIAEAGFRLIRQEDVTDNAARVSNRWHQARHIRRDDLLRIEGEERFEGLQRFFETVHQLTREKRLSRIAYVVEKPQT